MMKYFGCAYYPEYWGSERLETDASLMEKAGINVVRIGEFAWSRMEPSEGKYELDWLHQAVETMAGHGISVLMCTPTAAAPAWLVAAHPEALIVNKHGSPAWFGVRQHTCYASEVFRRYSAAITERLSREMSTHENVIAWQIDNEIGCAMFGNCHCEECQKKFRGWLRKKYGSLKNLNQLHRNAFWSMDYSDWEEIRLGDKGMNLSPSHVLDSLRFFGDIKVEYAEQQADIIRRNHGGANITTNNIQGIHEYQGHKNLSCAAADLYPRVDDLAQHAYEADLYRSLKPDTPFWVTETGIGGEGFPGAPHNNRLRAHFWHFFARGAEMIVVFRWRTCLSGQEQNLMGILEHSGKPRHRYTTFQKCVQEMRKASSILDDLPLPKAEAAVVLDHENMWIYDSTRIGDVVNYREIVRGCHAALVKRQVLADIIPPDRELSGYKIVVLASPAYVDKEFAIRLQEFVKGGGVLFCVGQAGMMDAHANYLPFPGPEHLGKLLGLSLEGGMRLSTKGANFEVGVADEALSGKVAVSGKIGGRKLSGIARRWIGDVEPRGGKVLMTFEDSTYEGQPAVIEKQTGRGVTLHLAAAQVDDTTMATLVDYACMKAGVRTMAAVPQDVEVLRRGNVMFIINHSAEPVTVPLDFRGKTLIGDFSKGGARLEPYGVCLGIAGDR